MMRASRNILAFLLVVSFGSHARAEDSIAWAPNLSAAQNMAARGNQLVLIHFWGPNCPPCLSLERNVFPLPYFGQAVNANYVPVKINVSEAPATTRQFGVTRWPQDVIITPEGEVVHRMSSPQDPQAYLRILHQVATTYQQDAPQVAASTQTSPTNPGYGAGGYGGEAGGHSQHPGAQSQAPSTAPAYDNAYQGTPQPGYQAQANPGYQSQATPGYQPQANQPAEYGSYQPQETQQGAYGTQDGYSNQPSSPSQGASTAPAYADSWSPPASGQSPQESADSYAPQGSQPAWQNNPHLGGTAATPPGASSSSQGSEETSIAAGNPPLCMEGHCSVTLAEEERWVRGDVRWGVIHRGRTYLFASQAHQQQFLANPDRFAPMLSGNDPVCFVEQGELLIGNRAHGVYYQDQMYLFTSEESLQTFWQDPDRYAGLVIQAMQGTVRYQ